MNDKHKRNFLDEFGELLAPVNYKCMLCGKDIFDDLTGLCDKCKQRVVFNNGKTCKRCGVKISGEEEYCTHCNFEKVYFDRAYSAFVYEQGIKDIIYSVKFGNYAALCRILANYLVYLAVGHKIVFDKVCGVPMTEKAKKVRGYNQAQLLAEWFCDILDNGSYGELLVKTKETPRQEQFGKRERLENLIGAYKLKDGIDVKGSKIIVIDDVKTSGATLNECAKVLKRAGASEVICLTVASREETFVME